MLKRKTSKMSYYPVEKNEAKLLLGSGKDAKEVHLNKVVKDKHYQFLLEHFSISI